MVRQVKGYRGTRDPRDASARGAQPATDASPEGERSGTEEGERGVSAEAADRGPKTEKSGAIRVDPERRKRIDPATTPAGYTPGVNPMLDEALSELRKGLRDGEDPFYWDMERDWSRRAGARANDAREPLSPPALPASASPAAPESVPDSAADSAPAPAPAPASKPSCPPPLPVLESSAPEPAPKSSPRIARPESGTLTVQVAHRVAGSRRLQGAVLGALLVAIGVAFGWGLRVKDAEREAAFVQARPAPVGEPSAVGVASAKVTAESTTGAASAAVVAVMSAAGATASAPEVAAAASVVRVRATGHRAAVGVADRTVKAGPAASVEPQAKAAPSGGGSEGQAIANQEREPPASPEKGKGPAEDDVRQGFESATQRGAGRSTEGSKAGVRKQNVLRSEMERE